MAESDMMKASVLVLHTMSPTVSNMAGGVPATMWHRIAVAAIVHLVEVATHLHLHIDPLLLPAPFLLFRRVLAAVIAAVALVVVRDIKCFSSNYHYSVGNNGFKQTSLINTFNIFCGTITP
jgi:hypothetical protein